MPHVFLKTKTSKTVDSGVCAAVVIIIHLLGKSVSFTILMDMTILKELISSTNAKPKSLNKVALIALLTSDLVSLTQQGEDEVVPQKTKTCPHWENDMGWDFIFMKVEPCQEVSLTQKKKKMEVPGRPLCLCFEI